MVLLHRNADFDGAVFRNITSLRKSVNLFDDLVPGDAFAQAAANACEMGVRQPPVDAIHRAFWYSAAIGHPFQGDRAVASRFGDGTLRVWYGALDDATALAETAWHAIQQLRGIEGVAGVVVRERAVYRVHAHGLFVDIRGEIDNEPALVANDYAVTQPIGKRLAREGHPGLLYASPCWKGDCLAAFRPEVLAEPRLAYFLTYHIDPVQGTLSASRGRGFATIRLALRDLRRR